VWELPPVPDFWEGNAVRLLSPCICSNFARVSYQSRSRAVTVGAQVRLGLISLILSVFCLTGRSVIKSTGHTQFDDSAFQSRHYQAEAKAKADAAEAALQPKAHDSTIAKVSLVVFLD